MSVKLYRNNESGEVVAAYLSATECGFYQIMQPSSPALVRISLDALKDNYTPLPEAPEVGSDEWAIAMVKKGHKVRREAWPEGEYLYMKDVQLHRWWTGEPRDTDDIMKLHFNDWQLYAPPKPIVEYLPHNLPTDVLCRNKKSDKWQRADIFDVKGQTFDAGHAIRHWIKDDKGVNYAVTYCLPYAENAHLEGQITDGEHGAVPKGYVPPHTPQLGDADYWMVGDEVVCLANNHEDVIEEISEQTLHLNMLSDFTLNGCYPWINGGMSMRVLYHKGSYVLEDGTVHEHIPTRPHRIES